MAHRDERIQDIWITSAGYSAPALFTLGTLPRTDPDVRTPHRNNWDFVAAKDLRLGGSVARANQTGSAERHEHRQGPWPDLHAGQFDLRSDSRAGRLHAADAGDVPHDVLDHGSAEYAEDTESRRNARKRRRDSDRAAYQSRPVVFCTLIECRSLRRLRPSCWPFSASQPVSSQGPRQIPATPAARRSERSRSQRPALPKAQADFIRGVLWLHSFGYEDAIDAFRAAQKIDPQFVMAYWGEAMCFNQPLWFGEEPDKARAALAKLGPTPAARAAKAKTPREQMYLAAVEALYGSGAKPARDQALRRRRWPRWPRKFPQDDEAQAFYALSLLAMLPRGDQALPLREKAGAIAEGVFKRNPQHPGAPHYILHAYDHAQLAARALPAARAYAKIAPAASHALHMPAHAFVQLGIWDEAAATDEASWDASIAWAKRRKLVGRDARLSQPVVAAVRVDAAGALRQVDRRADAGDRAGDEGRAARAGEVGGHHYADSEIGRGSGVDGAAQRSRVDASAPRDRERALGDMKGQASFDNIDELFALGMSAVKLGDLAKAVHGARGFREGRDVAGQDAGLREQATVMLHELARCSIALRRAAAGGVRGDGARDRRCRRACRSRSAGPIRSKGADELYGELLLQAGRPKEAVVWFERALARTPNRSRAVLGLARAAAKAGETAKSRARLQAVSRQLADLPIRTFRSSHEARTALKQ